LKEGIRQPKQGYLTDTKNSYRNIVYENFFNLFKGKVGDKKLLFLPANHDEEIKVALKVGFKEENMYAVDDNPAMLATVKWRKDYPKINVIGARLGRAFERLKEKGIKIDAANLDLCTNLQLWMFEDLSYFVENVMSEECALGITLLKGRESSSEIALAKLISKTQTGAADRIKICYDYIMKTTEKSLMGKLWINEEYKSGNQIMVFGVAHFFSGVLIGRHLSKIYEKLVPKARYIIKWDNYFYKFDNKIKKLNYPYVKRKRIVRKGDKSWDPKEYRKIYRKLEDNVLDMLQIKRNKLNAALKKYKKNNFYLNLIDERKAHIFCDYANCLSGKKPKGNIENLWYEKSYLNTAIYVTKKAMPFESLLWEVNEIPRHRHSEYGSHQCPI
jgi:hypothetical protein